MSDSHHGLLPPADPGGAARARLAPIEGYDDRAAAALDAAQSDPGGAVGGPPEPAGPTASADAARDTPTLDALVAAGGDRWLVSRTPPRVTLTCPACYETLTFLAESGAARYVAGGGACGCGGPTPPAPGAARKPLQDHLATLYGSE